MGGGASPESGAGEGFVEAEAGGMVGRSSSGGVVADADVADGRAGLGGSSGRASGSDGLAIAASAGG